MEEEFGVVPSAKCSGRLAEPRLGAAQRALAAPATARAVSWVWQAGTSMAMPSSLRRRAGAGGTAHHAPGGHASRHNYFTIHGNRMLPFAAQAAAQRTDNPSTPSAPQRTSTPRCGPKNGRWSARSRTLLLETGLSALLGLALGGSLLVLVRRQQAREKRLADIAFDEKERDRVTLQSIGDAVITNRHPRGGRLHEPGGRAPGPADPGRSACPSPCPKFSAGSTSARCKPSDTAGKGVARAPILAFQRSRGRARVP